MNIFLKSIGWRQKLGKAVFLPSIFGWGGSIFLIALILLGWYLLVTWNEESNKFTIGI